MTAPDATLQAIAARGSITDREYWKFTNARDLTDPEPVHVTVDSIPASSPVAVSTATATYTSSGDHILVTAGASSVRSLWVYAQAKGVLDTGTVLVTFTLGSNVYTMELTGSQMFSHTSTWEGSVGQNLVVNTSSTAAVIVNADFKLF